MSTDQRISYRMLARRTLIRIARSSRVSTMFPETVPGRGSDIGLIDRAAGPLSDRLRVLVTSDSPATPQYQPIATLSCAHPYGPSTGIA
jgi:hypothetical protein